MIPQCMNIPFILEKIIYVRMSSGSKVSVDEGVDPEGSSSSLTSVKVHRLKGIKDGQYSNPVFKKLSVINGEINRMPREELIAKLGELKLDSR